MEKKTEILCNACNCVHHDGDCHCSAEEVKIGCANACSCSETLCSTFELDSKR